MKKLRYSTNTVHINFLQRLQYWPFVQTQLSIWKLGFCYIFHLCDQMLQKIKYNSVEFPMFFYVGANKIIQCGHDVWNWYHGHVPKILPNFWSNSVKVYIYVRNFAAILWLFSKWPQSKESNNTITLQINFNNLVNRDYRHNKTEREKDNLQYESGQYSLNDFNV